MAKSMKQFEAKKMVERKWEASEPNRSECHSELVREFVAREALERQRRVSPTITWPTRLTIILVGTSILFSLFFGLEFLVTKLAANHWASAGSQLPPSATKSTLVEPAKPMQASERKLQSGCAEWPRLGCNEAAIDWMQVARGNAASIGRASASKSTSRDDEALASGLFGPTTSKLGVDFDLIYEHELSVTRDARHFKKPQVEEAQPVRDGLAQEARGAHLLVQAELKLNQLLVAHRAAMPFEPDIWSHSEPQEQLHLLSGHAPECRRQLHQLVSALERAIGPDESRPQETVWPLQRVGLEHYRLMKLLDSFGRPEAGALLGHPFWLGAYLECKQIGQIQLSVRAGQLNETTPAQAAIIDTRYCVGKLTFKSWQQAWRRRQLQMEVPPAKSSIKVGLCLPKACDSLALFRAQLGVSERANETLKAIRRLTKQLIKFNLNERIYPAEQFHLHDLFCAPLDERRRLGLPGNLLLVLLVAWLGLMIASTCLRRSGAASNRLTDIMAIDTNLKLFLELPDCPSGGPTGAPECSVNLNVLDCVKHLGCAGVILAHVLLAYLTLGTGFNHTIETLGRDLRTMLLLSLNNFVDTFFLISGLLVTYLTLKKLEPSERATKADANSTPASQKKRLLQYLEMVARRYLRMAPLYFLVYAFAKSLSVHLGEGPLWDYATNRHSLRGMCRVESWWWALLFASDFKPITQHCVPPAWSLAADLQFFLVLPLLVFGLASSSPSVRRFTRSLVVSLIVLSTGLTMHQYKSLFDFVSMRDFARLRLHVFTVLIGHAHSAYSEPQHRMGPILIGLLGGRLLHQFERKKLASWPSGRMRGAWFKLALALCLLSLAAPCFVQLRQRALDAASSKQQQAGSPILKLLANFLAALNTSDRFDCHLALAGFVLIKPIWSLCNCLVLLRLMSDLKGSFVARLMAHHFWRVLSKLNYALLLVHFELIAFESMSRLSLAEPITWPQLMCKFAFAYLFSLLVAGPLHVLFEQPLHRLFSWLVWRESPADLGRQQRQQNKQPQGDLRQQLRDMQTESEAGAGRR